MHLHRLPTTGNSSSTAASACTECITRPCITRAHPHIVHGALMPSCREYQYTHSHPSSYVVINFNIPSSSPPLSARDLVKSSGAHDVLVGEDAVYSFHEIPYPPETNTILAPHKSVIQHLIGVSSPEDIQHLPVGRHLQQNGSKPSLTGGLQHQVLW
ncbi:hypothetical protein DFH29DRAFT_62767 [Suillus ampliporus]|nr:hypothetical protein DFH29DRAFT_62767 [Suillus ampliporus]